MPKKKERLTRLGLIEKSEKIMFAVTPGEKLEIQAVARGRGETVTGYLLALHKELGRDVGGTCATCGKAMDGRNGRRRAIVGGWRAPDLCNLCNRAKKGGKS